MDVEPITTGEPVRGPEAISEVPDEQLGDCKNLDLANQLQRIHDHRVQAYQNPNTTMAIVGGMLCDLADHQARLSQLAREDLQGGGLAEEDAGLKMSAFDLIIRLVKTSLQIAQLENRSSSVE